MISGVNTSTIIGSANLTEFALSKIFVCTKKFYFHEFHLVNITFNLSYNCHVLHLILITCLHRFFYKKVYFLFILNVNQINKAIPLFVSVIFT